MKRWAIVCIGLLITLNLGGRVLADPTNTPTPTITLTPNNNQRADMATVVPPAACGDVFNPCVKLPWSVPVFPTVVLPSPTLVGVYMADVGATPQVGGTPTPTATGTQQAFDVGPITTLSSGISNASNTLVAVGAATLEIDGTQESVENIATEVAGNMPSVFSTVKGVLAATDNRAMSVVRFLFLCVLFVIGVYLLTLTFPIILRIIEFILQVITAIKPF